MKKTIIPFFFSGSNTSKTSISKLPQSFKSVDNNIHNKKNALRKGHSNFIFKQFINSHQSSFEYVGWKDEAHWQRLSSLLCQVK